jgi:hypothetical protein
MWKPEYIFRVCFIISEFFWSNKDYTLTAMLENTVIGKQKTLRNIKGLRGERRRSKWKEDPQPFHVSRSGLKLGRHKAIIVSPSANHRWATRKIIPGYGVIKMCHGEAYIHAYIPAYYSQRAGEWREVGVTEPRQARWKAMERVRIDGCSIHKSTTDDFLSELRASGHEGHKKCR